MIHARGLTRRFGDRLAVDRLDLDVAPGEVLGFLGPNGAGKTTTVRMLSALIAPTEGEATVAGHDVRREPDAVRRKVGILTETPGLYDRLSTRRNLEIFAELYEVADVAGQVRKYLELLELWDRRDDPAGSLSKGMRQKLAICRALLHEPPLVFLDEPTSALDPEAARLVRDFVAELKAQGRTIFLCTHNLDEADRLCDRVALFEQRLLVVDRPDHLRDVVFGRQVVVELEGASEDHVAVVRGLPFAPEASRDGDRIIVRSDALPERNPELISALVHAGARVRFVSEVRHSLEQLYFELVGDK